MSYIMPDAVAQETVTSSQAPSSAPAGAQPPGFISFLPLVAIVAVFYLLVIRPQNKRYKAHVAMQNSVDKGTEIVTNGGLIGKVTKVEDNGVLHVDIAEGTSVRLQRSGVASVYQSAK